MSAKNSVEVVIDGKVYTLSGYENEEYLNKVASYINNKILELKQSDSFRRQNKEVQSTMMYLNIADDYYKVKKQMDILEMDLEDKNKEIYNLKQELVELKLKEESAESELENLKKEYHEQEMNLIKLETELSSEQKNNRTSL